MEATFYGAPRVRFQTFKALTHVREVVSEARRVMETLKPLLIFDEGEPAPSHSEQYWQLMIGHLENIYDEVTALQQHNAQDSIDAMVQAAGDEPWKS